jgi:hypothetical protein
MVSPRFSKDVIAQMRLSQLRELARRLGVGRYSSMLRQDLLSAIQAQAPRANAAESFTEPTTVVVPPVQTANQASSEETPSVLAAMPSTETSSPAELSVPVAEGPTWVWFQPLDSQWALVRWGIHSVDREQARAAGGQQLVLRITDVTDRLAQDGRPHTLQEVMVEANSQEWHIPIPLGERDYRVELGYRTSTGGWISLGFSSVARMPGDLDLGSSAFVPFSMVETRDDAVTWEAPRAMPGQHERLYQQSNSGYQRPRLGSEAFHEQGAWSHGSAGGHLSGAGPWASGREASGAGLAPRQRSFWLVADAELIVYGATDPAATLTVGADQHALTSDGTFRLHMAFPDGDQTYPIQALAADGEQKRSITLDFRRTTPHAHVNAREAAVAEWF